jgi:hypothetical protein
MVSDQRGELGVAAVRLGGLGHVVRAESTKLMSLRSTHVCLALTVGFTVIMAAVAGVGNRSAAGPAPRERIFAVQFVHQTLVGDGTLVAHVGTQTGHDGVAGVMVADRLIPKGTSKGAMGESSPTQPEHGYAAMMLRPGGVVEWQGGLSQLRRETTGTGRNWLKVVRTGTWLTGYDSPDGRTWRKVGAVDLAGFSARAAIGVFVGSPSTSRACTRHSGGTTSCAARYVLSTAVFDPVRVTDARGQQLRGEWTGIDTSGPLTQPQSGLVTGRFDGTADRLVVSGAGDLGEVALTDGNDLVHDLLTGVLVGFVPIAVVGTLFFTSEFRQDTIRTTFSATPRRGRVLAAKALVVGGVTIVVGVGAAAAGYLIGRQALHPTGYAPPTDPVGSLADGPVIRAVVGSGLVLALLGVLALALAAILRRTAVTLTVVLALVLVPFVVGPFLSLDGEAWLKRLTPAAGFAVQQTRDRFDNAIEPWPGVAVLCMFVAVALAVAHHQLRRRDP